MTIIGCFQSHRGTPNHPVHMNDNMVDILNINHDRDINQDVWRMKHGIWGLYVDILNMVIELFCIQYLPRSWSACELTFSISVN